MIIIGHFRVPPGLRIKTRLSAQPLIWKRFFILMQIKLISQERLWTWPLFESEGLWNSEVAYYVDKVWKKSMKWYWRLFMAIFKDFYSGSKKSIHDCTITCSFSPHPWFTTLHIIRAAYLNMLLLNFYPCRDIINALKLLTDHYYVTDIWKKFGRYSVEVNATTIPDGQECFQFHVSSR